ncbi:MAG: hypothetical protein EA382_13565 [Spirochaetaceae bacterium]|nr:MAG: hypothetical protein EA382_13565 [Spirochaetaceae bacterium]
MVNRRLSTTRQLLFLALIAALTGIVSAQTSGTADQSRSTMVARLRVSIREPQIRLSWVPADTAGNTIVYRSTTEFADDSFEHAEVVGIVAADVSSFIDVPPQAGSYHYAVVATDADGTPFRSIVPGRNSTLRPVEIAGPPELDGPARITSIAAIATPEGAVTIAIGADRTDRMIAVYRSTSPIRVATDLAGASMFRRIDSRLGSIDDLPVPGIGYYYAAFDAQEVLDGTVTVRPGENATVQSVTIPLPESARPPTPRPAPARVAEPAAPDSDVDADGRLAPEPDAAPEPGVAPQPEVDAVQPPTVVTRGIPLPFLRPQAGFTTGTALSDPRRFLPEPVAVSVDTERAIGRLMERSVPVTIPEGPPILREDRLADPQGIEYRLRTIIDGPIRLFAWEEAIEQIDALASLPLPSDLRARTHYYRGRALHAIGERREALLEFLVAREYHYAESQAWIRVILAELAGSATASQTGF